MASTSSRIRAGDWEASLSPDGALSNIRIRGVEVLRDLMIVVRDQRWGTVPGQVEIVSETVLDDRFEVRLVGRYLDDDVDFGWTGTVSGAPEEGITYRFDGTARTEFEANRIGFVALHPLRWAGEPVTVTHSDGREDRTAYPRSVTPDQPFLDIVALRQPAAGGEVCIAFSGDIFETEDQRNWSDASFKTYSRPLSLPFPVRWRVGDSTSQSVRLTHRANTPPQPRNNRARVTTVGVRLGDVLPVPAIGLSVGPQDRPGLLTAELAALAPRHLRVDVALEGGEMRGLELMRETAMTGIPLELAIHLGTGPTDALVSLRRELESLPGTLSAVAVFDATAPSTTAAAIGVARTELGSLLDDVPLLVGTDDFLAELNRNRIDPDAYDAAAVLYSVNSAVHDLRDDAMLQTADAVAAMVDTVRSFPSRAVAVSPLTLRARRNIHGGGRIDRLGRDSASVDDRQGRPFAAAWLIAMLQAHVEAKVSRLTVFELSGLRGVVRAPGGSRYPVFDVLAAVGGATAFLRAEITDPTTVAAVGVRGAAGAAVLIGNRTGERVPVDARTRTIELDPYGYAVLPDAELTQSELGKERT